MSLFKILPKEMVKTRDELIIKLADAEREIKAVTERYNAFLAYTRGEAQAAVNRYNAIIQDACDLRDKAEELIQDAIDKCSETWRESPSGQCYVLWRDLVHDLVLEETGLELGDDVAMPELVARAELEQHFQTVSDD